jgi:hypothetical protein
MGDVKRGNLTGVYREFLVGRGAHPADAMLAINSTTKGLLPPRMSTAQREAIATPTEGLLVFDTTVQRMFVFADGAWQRVGSEAVEEPLAMYVDGTAGDDANDGLSWGTAKKTFGFLMADEPDSLPRQLNAAVTIDWRNPVRARSAKGLLILDGFYGGGSITIRGALTPVETFTATAYSNDPEVRGSLQWVADPTKAWTPNQWRRHFVNLGHTWYYPIRENNATTLWMGFGDDQAGAYAATIYSAPELLRELDADPGVKYAFDWDNFVYVHHCNLPVTIQGMWIDEDGGWGPRYEDSFKVYNTYVASPPPAITNLSLGDLSQCYINHTSYGLMLVYGCEVLAGNTAFDSTDGTGYGVYVMEGGSFTLMESWIGNQLFAMDVISSGVIVFNRSIYIQDCDVGVLVEGGKVVFATPIAPPLQLRFDTVRQAFVGMGDLVRQAEFEIRGWAVDHEFVFSDNDVGSFADFSAARLQSRVQLRLCYSDADYLPILQDEYSNDASKLTAVRYQTAIDELAALTIKADETFYVDGDVGSDAADGLSWGTAKKTFAFLRTHYGEVLPLVTVRVYARGTVLSADNVGHLQIKRFTGAGTIEIIGAPTTVVATLTPTAYQNTSTAWDYHAYVDVSGATWTPNEYQGRYIKVAGNASYYPILSNTATRLWSTDLPDMSGATRFDIVDMTIIRPATVAAPGVPIAYVDDYIEVQDSSIANVLIQNFRIERENKASPQIWLMDRYLGERVTCQNVSFEGLVSLLNATEKATMYLDRCYVDLRDLGFVGSGNTAISGCCLFADDGGIYMGNGIYSNRGATTGIARSHIVGMWYGLEGSGRFMSIHDVLFRDCLYGVFVQEGSVLSTGIYGGGTAARFKDCGTCLAIQQGTYQIFESWNNWVIDACTTQLWLADGNTALFSEIGTRAIANAATASSVVEYDYDATYEPANIEEYSNAVSGLLATRFQTAIDEMQAHSRLRETDTLEPTGFPFADQFLYSVISFDNANRRFTIRPNSPPFSSYHFWVKGQTFTKTTALTVDIPDTEGIHGIYFDATGALAVATNPSTVVYGQLFREYALCAWVYWDATNKQQIYFANERHGITMDSMTHETMHWRFGMYLTLGGNLVTFQADESGASAAHAQFGLESSMVVDEDLTHFAAPVAATTGLPIYYRDGLTGVWRRALNAGYAVLTTGTGRLAWNELTGGAWQQTEVPDGGFVLAHVFATNDAAYKFFAVQGQAAYATLEDARNGAATEMNALIPGALPAQEWSALGTVIFQTNDLYANAVKGRVRKEPGGLNYVTWLGRNITPRTGSLLTHNALDGLNAGDYKHLTAADNTQLTTNVRATNHWHIPSIANFRTVGQVGSQCDYALGVGSIAAACAEAKASGVTPANPWVVQVYPGVYPEPKFTLVPGLYLVCAQVRMDSVFIVAIDPADDLIVMDGGGHLFGPHLIGVSGANKYLVRCETEGGFSSLMDLAIHSCSNGILIANGYQAVGTNLAMIIGGPANNIGTGLTVTGVGAFTGTPSFLAMQGFFANVSPLLLGYYANNPIQRVMKVTAGAQGFIATGSFRVAAKDNTADVIFVDDGGFCYLSAVELAGCETALHIGSVGAGSELLVHGSNLQGNTLDVKIESATGRAFINVTVDTLTQSIVAGAKVIGSVQSRDAESQAFIGEVNYQYLASGRQADLGEFFHQFISTGVIEGGEVTALGGLDVAIAAGKGWVRRGHPDHDAKWVTWDLTTPLALTASNTNYVYVEGATGLVKKTLTPVAYGDSILLRTIITDGVGIRFSHQTRTPMLAPAEQDRDYLLATRPRALISGLTCATGTGVRNITTDSGAYYIAKDRVDYTGVTDATWSYFYGAGGATEVPSVTQVNITEYDLAGVLTAMTADWFRADTLVLTSDGRLSLIYGTAEFETQPEAEAALTANIPTFLEASKFELYQVIVKQGVGIESFIDIRPQPATGGGGGGGAGTTVHGLLGGLTADDHPHYLLAAGTRAMSGDLQMGTHNITNVGTVDGVTVSAHAARHLPGGLDFLATAAPVAIGAANVEGDAASFAKSNHVHDHGAQSTDTHHAVASAGAAGFMSAAHFTKVETGIPDYAQYVTVAKSGGDYTDPATALAAIVDATASKRYCLQIFPGEYAVNLSLKDYVDIIGVGPPRSVVLKSSSGTVVTMSNANRADLRNLTVQRTSAVNGDHCIEVTAGTHLLFDCVIEQFSTDAYGCLIHTSGTGTLQINTGACTLVQAGTATGAGNDNVLVHSEGGTIIYVRGVNATLSIEDANDNAIAFKSDSAGTETVIWQNSIIDVNVTAAVYSGVAAAMKHSSVAIDKYIADTRIRVRKTVGGASGTGTAFICASLAGGAYIKSTHNVIDVTGFANNYLADIATGDLIVTEFDSVVAANGAIGAGTITNDDGTKLFHGVYARSTAAGLNCLPTHITTTTFTLGATANPIRYFYKGVSCTVAADKTATLDDGVGGSTAGYYWVYFNRATGTLLATKTFPGFTSTSNVVIAGISWNGSNYGLVSDERHSYLRDTQWHAWAHDTVGTRYRSGFDFAPTGTGLGATFTMSGGELWDEDIAFSALASASWPAPHALRTLYQTDANTYAFDTTPSTIPFRAGAAGRPTYVNLTGYVLTQASSAANRYFNFFVYGATDLHTPVYCVAETVSPAVAADNGYRSLVLARAAAFPSLANKNLSGELKPLYRLIVRADGVVQAIAGEDDYRLVSSLPMAGGITSTTASAVTFTPAGDISSANVQLALEELDAEKAALAAIPDYETSTANILMDGAVSVGTTSLVPRSDHRHPTDTSRLAAARGNWKLFHSNGSGVFSEIALGAAGTVLKGGGVAAAPSFGAVGGVFPVFNVKDYGAVGDGIADDTTAIRDTLTAAAAAGDRGATIFFPGGIYKTTGTITVNDVALTFRGPGAGAALINPTSTNLPVFQLTAGNEFITFRDLEIGTITAQVAGSSFIDTNGAHNVLIDRVNMFGWYYGIYIRGGSGKVTVSNVQLKDGVATNGVGVYVDNSTALDVNLGPWIMVTNGAGAKPLAGIMVKAAGAFSIQNVTVNNVTHGLYLYPSSGANVQYGFISDSMFDLAGTNGAYLYTPNQASPGQLRSIKFVGCWFGRANAAGVGHGVTLEGASNGVLDDVSFASCRFLDNGRHGINYLFGTNIRVNGSTVAGNSASASNTYDGIAIAAAVSDFELVGNRIGLAGTAANTQRYAINIAAGASNRYQIIQNDVGNNNTAPFINDGGTGVFKRIAYNNNAMPISAMPALTTAMQALAVSANVLTGSLLSLPVNSLLVGTRFVWEIVLIKTAAGTATWAVQVKFGTTGGTGDTAIASWTSGTNTAAIDQARLRIVCDILTLGAAATARCNAFYVNTLTSATGLGRIAGAPTATATFNSAASPAFIHVGVTPGASAVMTSMCDMQII